MVLKVVLLGGILVLFDIVVWIVVLVVVFSVFDFVVGIVVGLIVVVVLLEFDYVCGLGIGGLFEEDVVEFVVFVDGFLVVVWIMFDLVWL